MREPHAEGGSDSTVTPSDGLAAREGRSQAFTGARAGQLLSREILINRGADVVVDTEGNIADGASASRSGTPRGRRTCACPDSPCRRTWRPHVRPAV